MPRRREKTIKPCCIEGFNERFREAIFAMDMSNSEICRRAGVSRSSLDQYFYGHMPRADVLCKLAPVLNVSVDWLLGLSKKKELR